MGSQIQEIARCLKQESSVVVLTGAGISAESGIPTFREAQTGLWEKYSPQELATPEAFEKNPHLVWQWYSWRRDLVQKAAPNAAHFALAKMEAHFPDFTLVTQNVDGLHQRAGSRNVIEIHGNILRTKCAREGRVVDAWQSSENETPRCPQCGAFLRPDVVWFGESLPLEAIETAFAMAGSADVLFSIGTSGVVEPAASLPYLALRSGATVVEINLDPTPLTLHAQYSIRGQAAVVVPELVEAIKS